MTESARSALSDSSSHHVPHHARGDVHPLAGRSTSLVVRVIVARRAGGVAREPPDVRRRARATSTRSGELWGTSRWRELHVSHTPYAVMIKAVHASSALEASLSPHGPSRPGMRNWCRGPSSPGRYRSTGRTSRSWLAGRCAVLCLGRVDALAAVELGQLPPAEFRIPPAGQVAWPAPTSAMRSVR
jgi:hypothetical protein